MLSIGCAHTKSLSRGDPFTGKIQFSGESWLSTLNQVNIGTGDFTIEFWVNIVTNPGTNQGIIGLGNSSNNFAVMYSGSGSSSKVRFETYMGATKTIYASTVNLPLNQWVHIAVVRNSAKFIKLYQNGINVYTSASAVNTSYSTGTQGYVFGRQYTDVAGNSIKNGCQLTGIRISTICRYTANFTPVANKIPHSVSDYAVFNFHNSTNYLTTENGAYTMTSNTASGFASTTFVAGYP